MSDSFQELLRQIEAGASEVRATGDELTKRIKAFEEWLSKLPGRVPASCRLFSSRDDQLDTFLSFDKDGKTWLLYVINYHVPYEEEISRTLLRDASIDTKAWAMRNFPELLKSIAKRQRELVKSAKESITQFEAFATEIGLKEGA